MKRSKAPSPKKARRPINRHRGVDPAELPQVRNALWASVVVISLVLGALVGRLWYLQVLHGEEYRAKSENNRIRMVDVPPIRGLIYDTNGALLADNRPAFTLAVVPEDVRDWDELGKRLNELVGITPEEIDQARKAARGMAPIKPVRLRTHLSRDQLAKLETFRYELPGVVVQVEYRRAYLAATDTAHVIGYLGEINREELERAAGGRYRLGDFVGRSGLERTRERVLQGKRGARQVEVDAVGRELNLINYQDPVPGHDLILTIDLDLQKAAAQAMGDEVGAVVAMNPQNGQIYCLYSSPSYDQNNFITGMSGDEWRKLVNDERHPLKDRAISGLYPPGSTYKIVTAAAALAEGVADADTTVFCKGSTTLGRRTYRCWIWRRGGHGVTDLHKALRESCDVYFYKMGKSLGVNRLAKWARAFGLGRKTGVPLPHEAGGLVPTEEWKEKRFNEPWQEGETLSVAIGQGFNLATPLQLARMISVIANNGKLVTPTLVRAVVRPEGGEPLDEPPGMISPVPLKQEQIDMIKNGLSAVVNEPHGTGWRAKVPGVEVAGKTGTAQVVSLKTEKTVEEEEIPWKFRDHALFVAFAPVPEPTIAVAVVVEHGGHGGSDAAPVAQKVMAAYFKKHPPVVPAAEDNQPENPAARGAEPGD